LDNNGIKVRIAENEIELGKNLAEKFKNMISSSNIFLIFLTEYSVRSKWVKLEYEYARQLGKTIVPIKEEGLRLNGSWFPADIEWIEFSKNDNFSYIQNKIADGINKIAKGVIESTNRDFLEGLFTGAIITGILFWFFGRK